MDEDQKRLEVLKIAADVRKFEIGLFWSRSLFFWGFSAVVITAYGATYSLQGSVAALRFSIASAGLICSVIWTLVNRSSKYWHKIWEEKAADASRKAIGKNLFAEPPRTRLTLKDFPWWSAHYSVSKLAIAFSDLAVLIWLGLALREVASISIVIIFVAVCTVIYLAYIFWKCVPDPRQPEQERQNSGS